MKAKLTPTVGCWLLCGGFLFVHVFWPKDPGPEPESGEKAKPMDWRTPNKSAQIGQTKREGEQSWLQTCHIVNGWHSVSVQSGNGNGGCVSTGIRLSSPPAVLSFVKGLYRLISQFKGKSRGKQGENGACVLVENVYPMWHMHKFMLTHILSASAAYIHNLPDTFLRQIAADICILCLYANDGGWSTSTGTGSSRRSEKRWRWRHTRRIRDALTYQSYVGERLLFRFRASFSV